LPMYISKIFFQFDNPMFPINASNIYLFQRTEETAAQIKENDGSG